MADNGSLFLQGAGVGGNLYSSGVENALRIQQLQSARAMQQFKERQAAAEVEMMVQQNAAFKDKLDNTIQERADMAKAVANHQIDTHPDNPVGISEEDSLMQNVLPAIARHQPDKVPQFLNSVALLPYRKAQAQASQNRAELYEAQTGLAQQRGQLLEAQTDKAREQIKQLQEQSQVLKDAGVEPMQDPNGEIIGYRAPNGKGGYHFFRPPENAELTFQQTPSGDMLVVNSRGHFQVLKDAQQIEQLKAKNAEIKQLNNRIGKIEDSETLSDEEKMAKLLPLKKQRNKLQDSINGSAAAKAKPATQSAPTNSSHPKGVPPNYVRIRVKATGKLGWADPDSANADEIEIIEGQ